MISYRPFYAISSQTTLDLHTGTYRSMRPVLGTKTAPCTAACPIGQDVRGFIQLMDRGDTDGALRLLLADNPLPGVTGRVCHHPCEAQCNRGEVDEPITIQALERAAASYGQVEFDVPPPRGKSVAVVGSGPAGLSCAFHLRKAGWEVTVLERDERFGGLLRTAIPAFRLPPSVLDGELARLKGMGISFCEGVDVGNTVSLEELRASFDAVFLALGAQGSRALEMPGLTDVEVFSGLEFLRSVNGLGASSVSGKVAVLGGGNTAIDVARTVKRLGGEPVICSPEKIEEMPAFSDEVVCAQAEDIPIVGGVTFSRFEAGTLTLKVGRKARKLEVSHLIVAIGEDVEADWLPKELVESGSLASSLVGATSIEGVFAGGDCTAGERTVAHAIGEGRKAALAIDAYLSHISLSQAETSEDMARLEDLNLDYCEAASAALVPEVPVAERIRDLSVEVRGGLERAVAQREASRCFGCGSCTTCFNCLVFCPDLAVVRVENERGLSILYEYCKGCGICVTECPSGALGLVRETEGA